MKFEELLKKYKDGLTTQEENEYIEAELEKHEAIAEYLAEVAIADIRFERDTSNQVEVKSISKAVKKRFRKFSYITIAIAVVVMLIVNMMMPKIHETMYYDPNRDYVGNDGRDGGFAYDLAVHTELHNPGASVISATATKIGQGDYELSYITSFKDNWSTTKNNSLKGKLAAPLVKKSTINYTSYSWVKYCGDDIINDCETPISVRYGYDKLYGSLAESSRISAFLPLYRTDTDGSIRYITTTQLKEMMDKYPGVEFLWASVAYDDSYEDNYAMWDIGFVPSKYGQSDVRTTIYANQQASNFSNISDYPYAFSCTTSYPCGDVDFDQHFIDMVEHMRDNSEFLEMVGERDVQFYDKVLEYIANKGIMIHGIYVQASPTQLLELIDSGYANGIYVEEIRE